MMYHDDIQYQFFSLLSFDLQILEYVGIPSDAFAGSLPRLNYMATYPNMFWASAGTVATKKLLNPSQSELLCTCRSAMKLNVNFLSAQHS